MLSFAADRFRECELLACVLYLVFSVGSEKTREDTSVSHLL